MEAQIELWGSVFLYLISWGAGLSPTLNERPWLQWTHLRGMLLGWFLHSWLLFYNLMAVTIWPDTFVKDVLIAVSWLSMVIIIGFREQLNTRINGAIVPIFAIILLGVAATQETSVSLFSITSEVWIYKSLLLLHIISFSIGYILFGLACIGSGMFLYQEYHLKTKLITNWVRHLPSLGLLEVISTHATRWGFICLSIGIPLGVILSSNREMGLLRLSVSVAAWFVYAMMLVDRHFQTTQGRRNQIWPIIGFGVILLAVGIEFLSFK